MSTSLFWLLKMKLRTIFLKEHFTREGAAISALELENWITAEPRNVGQHLPCVQCLHSIQQNIKNPCRGGEFCYDEVHLNNLRICRTPAHILDSGKTKDTGLKEELTTKERGCWFPGSPKTAADSCRALSLAYFLANKMRNMSWKEGQRYQTLTWTQQGAGSTTC